MSDVVPEQIAEGTVNDAARSLSGADALTVARMRQAEIARTEGPRSSLLERIDSTAKTSDQSMIDSNAGLDRRELAYVADLLGVDVSIVRATFDFLGRTRVSEDELRAAVAHVGAREV